MYELAPGFIKGWLMGDSVPDRMIASALKLLAAEGFQGASFSSVLADASAPRGSVYFHFRGGKEELMLAAIALAGEKANSVLDDLDDRRPDEIVSAFVDLWRSILAASDFQLGCAIAGATVTTGQPDIIEAAALQFRTWTERMTEILVGAGLEQQASIDFSHLVLAACEGAVVLCRAERSLVPLDSVERSLQQTLTAMTG